MTYKRYGEIICDACGLTVPLGEDVFGQRAGWYSVDRNGTPDDEGNCEVAGYADLCSSSCLAVWAQRQVTGAQS